MIIFAPIFALVICVLSVVLFEAIYGALSAHSRARFSKGVSCGIWWIVVVLSALPNGLLAICLYMPAIAVVGISHYYLARSLARTITVQDVAYYAPIALTRCGVTLRSLLKTGRVP